MIIAYPSRFGGFVIRAVDKGGNTLRMQRSMDRDSDWPIAAQLAKVFGEGVVEVHITDQPRH